MTREGWREIVLEAVKRHESGDDELLGLLSRLLCEQDVAKARLQQMGIACCGMPWASVVDAIEELNCVRQR